jgi:hypothetical protein
VLQIYSFAAAVIELQLRLGGRNDSSQGVLFTNRLANWLNSAQYAIAAAIVAVPDLEQVATLNLVNGQTEYSFNTVSPPLTDIIGIQQIQVVDGSVSPVNKQKLRRFPWNEYRTISQQATARPTRWSRKGNLLALDPVPNLGGGPNGYQLTIDYRKAPVQGQVAVPAQYSEAWIKLGEFYAWGALGQPDRAAIAKAMLPTAIQVLIENPLDQDQWEAMWDVDLAIVPEGWEGNSWFLNG